MIRGAISERDAASCVAIYAPFGTDTAVTFEGRAPTREDFIERIRAAQAKHA
jgi:phosphinothricin acetyltransferase